MIFFYVKMKIDHAIFNLCRLLLHLFPTTKRHLSDVEPSYVPIFKLIQLAVYSVGMSKDCTCLTLRILYRFSPKLIMIIASGHPKSVQNFSLIGV